MSTAVAYATSFFEDLPCEWREKEYEMKALEESEALLGSPVGKSEMPHERQVKFEIGSENDEDS